MAQTTAEAVAAYSQGCDAFAAEFVKLNKLFAELTEDERRWLKSPADIAVHLHKSATTYESPIRTLIRGSA